MYTTNTKSAELVACAIRKTLTSVRNSYLVILHHSTKPTGTQVQSIGDKAVKTQGALSSRNLGIYRRTNSVSCITTQNTQISLPTVNITANISFLSWLMHGLRYLKTDSWKAGTNDLSHRQDIPLLYLTKPRPSDTGSSSGRTTDEAWSRPFISICCSLLIHLHAFVFQRHDFIFYVNTDCRHQFQFSYSPENKTMEGAARWNGSNTRSLFSVHISLIRVYNTPTCLHKTEIYKNWVGGTQIWPV